MSSSHWEYREFTMPRGTGREFTRSLLTGFAETEHWELARLRLFPDGRRKVWLRRKIIRVQKTLTTQ